jgi:hypothetical protein
MTAYHGTKMVNKEQSATVRTMRSHQRLTRYPVVSDFSAVGIALVGIP